jgi:chromatin remodeling complex protein RSC6
VLVSKDAKLTALFESNKDVTMFQVMGVLSKHLKK